MFSFILNLLLGLLASVVLIYHGSISLGKVQERSNRVQKAPKGCLVFNQHDMTKANNFKNIVIGIILLFPGSFIILCTASYVGAALYLSGNNSPMVATSVTGKAMIKWLTYSS